MKPTTITAFGFGSAVAFIFISRTTSTQSLCDSPYAGVPNGPASNKGRILA